MNRRQFFNRAAAFSVIAGTVHPVAGFAALANDSWSRPFAAARQKHPWLSGYATAEREHFVADATIAGVWPTELTGTLYRNGPARHEIGGYRYHHWFDGDGMIHAYRMRDGALSHKARFVQTDKFLAEQDAGRALYPGFGSVPPNPAPVSGPDVVNVANISVLHHHDTLFALWEAGSPWEIDPQDLSTRGSYAFSEHTRGVPFSAHPRVEADGTLWNFGYVSGAGLLVFWHIDKTGKLVKVGKVKADPITMVHDFVVTQRHLVMLLSPFHYEATQPDSFLDAHAWHPEDATRVLVVDKNDFDNHFWLELPSQWVFHFGNGWEDDAGVIRFDGARADDPLVMIDTFRDIMRGKIMPPPASAHHQYRIDTKTKRASETAMFEKTLDSEFPSVDPRVSCRQNATLTMLTRDRRRVAPHIGLNEVSHVDLRSGERRFFRYPDTQIPEEHLFVPKAGSAPETDGWVVGTALDWKNECTLLNVFDVRDLEDGPIATATLPYALPLGLHGKFVADG